MRSPRLKHQPNRLTSKPWRARTISTSAVPSLWLGASSLFYTAFEPVVAWRRCRYSGHEQPFNPNCLQYLMPVPDEAIRTARERLDAHTHQIVQHHFHESTGCPF